MSRLPLEQFQAGRISLKRSEPLLESMIHASGDHAPDLRDHRGGTARCGPLSSKFRFLFQNGSRFIRSDHTSAI